MGRQFHRGKIKERIKAGQPVLEKQCRLESKTFPCLLYFIDVTHK
jgi:hypothetical protein